MNHPYILAIIMCSDQVCINHNLSLEALESSIVAWSGEACSLIVSASSDVEYSNISPL